MKTTTTARVENARRARAAFEAAPAETKADRRADYLTARAALLSVDFADLDGDEMIELCAAAVEKAMKRREAETSQDLPTMRIKYGEDARQETAARALEMISGPWIEGEYVTERDENGQPIETAPRAEMPLALFAAHAAGRALDSLIYADGGHAVKLTAKERREHYADRDDAPAVVTETRKTREPVAPSPEAAAIAAELLPRILDRIDSDATRKLAARLLSAIYAGRTLPESAAVIGCSERHAQRVMQAVCNAAALVKADDGERAELERVIASDARTMSNADRRARAAAIAAFESRLKTAAAPAGDAVRWTAGRPDRLARTARKTPADLEALRRAFYAAAARAE